VRSNAQEVDYIAVDDPKVKASVAADLKLGEPSMNSAMAAEIRKVFSYHSSYGEYPVSNILS